MVELDSETVVPVATDLVRVTEHVAFEPATTVAGAHCREDTNAGAVKATVALRVDPFSEAVTVAVRSDVTDAAETLKLEVAAPGGIVALAGAETPLAVSDTAVPPAVAGPLRAIVQAVDPEGPTMGAAHVREVTVSGAGAEVIVPPTAETAIAAASGAAPIALSIRTAILPGVPDNLTTADATMPLGMTEAFRPDATQRYAVGFPEQDRDLPAPVNAGPGLILMNATPDMG